MQAVRWAEFAEASPTLAKHVRQRFAGGIAYFATVRSDGWPRVHPVGVEFRDEGYLVMMFPSSPKGHDLRRNGRYAVHCTVEDGTGGGGEVLISGLAVPTEATEAGTELGWIAFELLVGEVLATTYDHDEKRPISERWTASESERPKSKRRSHRDC